MIEPETVLALSRFGDAALDPILLRLRHGPPARRAAALVRIDLLSAHRETGRVRLWLRGFSDLRP